MPSLVLKYEYYEYLVLETNTNTYYSPELSTFQRYANRILQMLIWPTDANLILQIH